MFTLKESVTGAVQILVDTLMCEKPEGETTGFSEFDNLTRGMRRGSLTVLVSPPSQGKTAFSLNIANHLIARSPAVPVLYCSDLCHTELAFRLLTIASGADCSYDGDNGAVEIDRLTGSVREIADRPLYFMDSRVMDEAFFREVAERQAEKHFGLMVFDPALADNLPRLKKLAQDLAVPILALASVETRELHIAKFAMADTVIILNRVRKRSDDRMDSMTLTVVGNRFGMRGSCRLDFAPQTMRFAEIPDEAEARYKKTGTVRKMFDRVIRLVRRRRGVVAHRH